MSRARRLKKAQNPRPPAAHRRLVKRMLREGRLAYERPHPDPTLLYVLDAPSFVCFRMRPWQREIAELIVTRAIRRVRIAR